jgi:hypothetical protein
MTPTGTVVVGADGPPTYPDRHRVRPAGRAAPERPSAHHRRGPASGVLAPGMPAMPTYEEVIEDTRRAAPQQLEELLSAHPQLASVPVTVEVATGAPGRALVNAGQDADVLV